MDRQVHLAEAHGLVDALLAVDGQPAVLAVAVLFHEARTLDEHAARAARRIKDLALERFDNFDDQADNRGRREVLAPLSTLDDRELPEEVLVYLAEGITLDVAQH